MDMPNQMWRVPCSMLLRRAALDSSRWGSHDMACNEQRAQGPSWRTPFGRDCETLQIHPRSKVQGGREGWKNTDGERRRGGRKGKTGVPPTALPRHKLWHPPAGRVCKVLRLHQGEGGREGHRRRTTEGREGKRPVTTGARKATAGTRRLAWIARRRGTAEEGGRKVGRDDQTAEGGKR
ncbi:unnamed protein product [Prorocentrum cordatum]|uniref:Uncharacterized protein n=1 Tax=Prorocentrum cordatum TaxID=2364126 RepID=A0ABN9PI72_9DINO|nr:unnamed protein product [Polarella glacialis]